MINLLRVTKESRVYSVFLKYPEVVFSPMTVALTANISMHTSKRICSEFAQEGKIDRVRRGYYKLKTVLVTA